MDEDKPKILSDRKATGFWDKKTVNSHGARLVIYRLMDITGKPIKLFIRNKANHWEEYDADAFLKTVESA